MDIAYQVMLTGDRRRAAEVIAREIGIPNVEAELLPEQKLDRVRQLMSQGKTVAMVGDGINDAPALAAASVGIAVAGASDITAEAADVVYMPHSLEQLPRLVDVSRKAMNTAWQNIFLFAGGVNLVAVILCATGNLGPIGAAMTHQLSSFFVMMNSLRLLRVERIGGGRFSRLLRVSRVSEGWEWLRERLEAIEFSAAFGWIVERRQQLKKPAMYAVGTLWLLSCVYMLGPNETGVVERFGRKVLPYSGPGLNFKLPWPVDRLTRIGAQRVRVVEVGFRSYSTTPDNEPAAYEWNVQHRSGRFQRKPEESLMLTGDQNMIELTATVHYNLARPDDFIFKQLDGDVTMRTIAESVLQMLTTKTPLDSILTTGRNELEATALSEMQKRADKYGAGIHLLRVKLQDVHPSLEVVDAFRDVSGAYEEKNRLINEAEGYRNEQVALARGNAKAKLQNANAYTLGRVNRADGDAGHFTMWEQQFRAQSAVNETRLYLETMEQVLPGRKKLIVDTKNGRRHLVLLDDGVEIAPPAMMPVVAPQRPREDE
jgi:Cu+-exporting ATPase